MSSTLLQWLTFVSATLAAGFQGRRQVQGWLYDQRDRREARRVSRSGWSATGVDTWTVRLEEPACGDDLPLGTGTVTLTVLGRNGEPSPDQAGRLRRYLEGHEYLSRNPAPDELAALEEATRESRKLAFRRARSRRLVT